MTAVLSLIGDGVEGFLETADRPVASWYGCETGW